MIDQLSKMLQHHRLYHSQYQQDRLITSRAGGSTIYGQYKQALRELYRRVRGIRESACNIELNEVKIDEYTARSKDETKDEFYCRKWRIKAKRARMRHEEALRVYIDTKREFKRFYQQACYLHKLLQEKYGDLTEAVIEKLDGEMWVERIIENIYFDIASKNRIGKNTFEMIINSPSEIKNKLIKCIKDNRALNLLMVEYENKETFVLEDSKLEEFRITDEEILQIESTKSSELFISLE